MPRKRLPIATPNNSAGTPPPKVKAASHMDRQRGFGSLSRNAKPTGRRMNAISSKSIARYSPEKDVAYSNGHAAKAAPPPRMNQTWFPSHTGSIDSSKARRSASVRPR